MVLGQSGNYFRDISVRRRATTQNEVFNNNLDTDSASPLGKKNGILLMRIHKTICTGR